MVGHLLMPEVGLTAGAFLPVYADYLKQWRERAIADADKEEVAASICLQATFIDLVLNGAPRHDWLGVMDELLFADELPLAYSEAYGAKLCGFAAQYRQSTVHSIHTRWWVELLCAPDKCDHARFAKLIEAKLQSDGLFYDFDVSGTVLRHRMKSELTMSSATAAEILLAATKLDDAAALKLATNLCDQKKCPSLGYMGMEYFRLNALRTLGHEKLFPVGIEDAIVACAEGLPVGWCDFAMSGKIDAYMGTAKRTQRDKPIHSPLTARHVGSLAGQVKSEKAISEIKERYDAYRLHLTKNPMDIPAFQMRDVPIPFGADRTPIELICASAIVLEGQP